LQVPSSSSSSSSSSSLWVIWVVWVWLFSLSPTELCIQLFGGWKWWILFFSRAICGWVVILQSWFFATFKIRPSLRPSLGPFTLLGLLLALALSFAVLDYLCFLPLNVGLLQKGFWPWRAESTNQTFSNCDCCRFSVVHFVHARFVHVQGCEMKVPYIESFTFSQ